jgi:phospholipase/carboxylesterase
MLVCDLVPPRVPHPTDRWLCLVLHGLGDTKEGWKPVTPMLGLDRLGFGFVQAPIPYSGGWSWFDIALGERLRIDHDQVREGRRLIGELVEKTLEQQRLPASRLFLLGFSQGCLMALDWGLRHPQRLAGIVGISGSIALIDEYPAAFGVRAPTQAVLMTHGLYDGVIPIQQTRPLKDRLITQGATLDWREYRKDHGLDPEDELPDINRWMAARMRAAS